MCFWEFCRGTSWYLRVSRAIFGGYAGGVLKDVLKALDVNTIDIKASKNIEHSIAYA